MILDLLVGAVFGLLEWVLSLLPTDSIPWPDVTNFGTTVGEMVGPLDAIVPVAETAAVTVLTVTVVAPGVLVFRLTMWLWGKIPVIGGGS